MWMTPDGMGWWMLFGGTLWVLFWIAVIYVVVSLVKGVADKPPRVEDDAVEIARRRYASGEITKDEFDAIRKDLLSTRGKAA